MQILIKLNNSNYHIYQSLIKIIKGKENNILNNYN